MAGNPARHGRPAVRRHGAQAGGEISEGRAAVAACRGTITDAVACPLIPGERRRERARASGTRSRSLCHHPDALAKAGTARRAPSLSAAAVRHASDATASRRDRILESGRVERLAHRAVLLRLVHELGHGGERGRLVPSPPRSRCRSAGTRRRPCASRAPASHRSAASRARARTRRPCRRAAPRPRPRPRSPAMIVVFFSVRPAARIVVVLAMPITRMPARSTSSTVFAPRRRRHHVGALAEHVVRPERDALLALLVDRHEGDIDLAGFERVGRRARNWETARVSTGTLSFLPSASARSAVTPRGLPSAPSRRRRSTSTARTPVRRAAFRSG